MDIVAERELSEYYNIVAIPTVLYIKQGQEVGRTEGFLSKEALKNHIKKNLD